MKTKNWIISNLKIIIFLLIFLFSSIYVSAQSGRVTNCEYLNLRNGPGLGYGVVRLLKEGDRVEIVGNKGEWYKVNCSGKEGWIKKKYLNTYSVDETENVVKSVGYINCNIANVRSGNSTVYKVIEKLKLNQKVSIVKKSGKWYKIVTPGGNAGWIYDSLVSSKITKNTNSKVKSVSTDSSIRDRIVNIAKSMVNVRYSWGGSSSSGVDCSGLVKYVYSKCGINLKRTSSSQSTQGQWKSRYELNPGDLVFFSTSSKSYINHVGIYIGNGNIVHSSASKRKVVIADVNQSYFRRTFVTARDVIN